MQTYQAILLGVGLTPIAILIAAGLLVGVALALRRFSQDDLVEIGGGLGIVAGAILIVSLFIGITCRPIHPVEMFIDISGTSSENSLNILLKDIEKTEDEICGLYTRVDKFIEGGLGKKGHDDPSLVSAAQAEARPKEPITSCPISPFTDDTSGSVILAEADNRISRMETALNAFVGPQLQKTYNRTVPCPAIETFVDVGPTIESLQSRLNAVISLLQKQKTTLLKPIDDKNERIQRHEVSDCEKQQGSKKAIAESNTAAGASAPKAATPNST
jgi:hypothetical protein